LPAGRGGAAPEGRVGRRRARGRPHAGAPRGRAAARSAPSPLCVTHLCAAALQTAAQRAETAPRDPSPREARMADDSSVLIVDDAELGEVRSIRREVGVEPAHLRGGAVPARLTPPKRLLVATARRAAVAQDWPTLAEGGPLRIGVVTEDSNALRDALRR